MIEKALSLSYLQKYNTEELTFTKVVPFGTMRKVSFRYRNIESTFTVMVFPNLIQVDCNSTMPSTNEERIGDSLAVHLFLKAMHDYKSSIRGFFFDYEIGPFPPFLIEDIEGYTKRCDETFISTFKEDLTEKLSSLKEQVNLSVTNQEYFWDLHLLGESGEKIAALIKEIDPTYQIETFEEVSLTTFLVFNEEYQKNKEFSLGLMTYLQTLGFDCFVKSNYRQKLSA